MLRNLHKNFRVLSLKKKNIFLCLKYVKLEDRYCTRSVVIYSARGQSIQSRVFKAPACSETLMLSRTTGLRLHNQPSFTLLYILYMIATI